MKYRCVVRLSASGGRGALVLDRATRDYSRGIGSVCAVTRYVGTMSQRTLNAKRVMFIAALPLRGPSGAHGHSAMYDLLVNKFGAVCVSMVMSVGVETKNADSAQERGKEISNVKSVAIL